MYSTVQGSSVYCAGKEIYQGTKEDVSSTTSSLAINPHQSMVFFLIETFLGVVLLGSWIYP